MRTIIAGWREFDDYELLKQIIEESGFEISLILSGRCPGTDYLGERFASEKNILNDFYPANWSLYGTKAGPIRNQEMADNADALIAILHPQSKGTLDMIKRAVNKNLKIYVYKLVE